MLSTSHERANLQRLPLAASISILSHTDYFATAQRGSAGCCSTSTTRGSPKTTTVRPSENSAGYGYNESRLGMANVKYWVWAMSNRSRKVAGRSLRQSRLKRPTGRRLIILMQPHPKDRLRANLARRLYFKMEMAQHCSGRRVVDRCKCHQAYV